MKTTLFLLIAFLYVEELSCIPIGIDFQIYSSHCILKDHAYLSSDTGILRKDADFWTGPPALESSMIFLKLSTGTKVRILESHSNYYKVLHRNLIGYVEKEVVKILSEEEEVTPVAYQPEEEQEVLTEKSPGVRSEKPALYGVTKETSLRAAPDSQARVYVRLKRGYKVEVLEDSGRWWWKVIYKDRVGWAKRALLEKL